MSLCNIWGSLQLLELSFSLIISNQHRILIREHGFLCTTDPSGSWGGGQDQSAPGGWLLRESIGLKCQHISLLFDKTKQTRSVIFNLEVVTCKWVMKSI